jgi:hypothetical protein
MANRNLESMQRAFEAGNPLGLVDAVIYCAEMCEFIPGLSLPPWALRALSREILSGLCSHKRRRKGRILRVYKQRLVDLERFETVEQCRQHGYSYTDIMEDARSYEERGDSGKTAWRKAEADHQLIPLRSDPQSTYLEKNEKQHSITRAIENAIKILEGTPAEGESSSIRDSYFRVKRLRITEPWTYYMSMFQSRFLPDFLRRFDRSSRR